MADTAKDYGTVAYYPGCALEGTGNAYDVSTRAIAGALGLKLDTVKDWNCCGAMEIKNLDPKLQTYLSSRVLSQAVNRNKKNVVMAPCNGCYHNLKKAEFDLSHDEESRDVVGQLSGKAGHATYQAGQAETIHALDWLKVAIGEDRLRDRCKGKLKGLKVANYYGCMYVRPRHIFPEKDKGPGSESTSKPHFMDDLLAAAGAENIEFPLKTACCGGAHTLSDSDTSSKLVVNILRSAEAGSACCQSQRSSGFGRMEKKFSATRRARGSCESSGRTVPVRRVSADIKSPSLCTNHSKTGDLVPLALDRGNPGN